MTKERLHRFASLFLRVALGTAFLSAVADRLGLWGPPGTPGVAWGNVEYFMVYTGNLNPYLPDPLIPALGWLVTTAEIAFGVALLIGWRTREVAFGSGCLLLAFGMAMALTTGVKGPFDYSVFSASAGAFLLAAYPNGWWSVDAALSGAKSGRV